MGTSPIREADRGLAMPASGIIARAIAAAIIVFAAPVGGSAQPTLKVFDAHLHYNQEPNPYYPLDRVLDVFRRNSVAGILANSRPNKGTHQLVDAKAPGLWVVPFIRPYRTRDDVQNWSTDPAIYDLIEAEYKRGYFRGIGEFHIYGNAAQAPLVKQVVDFAAGRNLYLLAHCDEAALLILLAHNRSAKIIWAHTGFSTPTRRVRELLETYPELMGELSTAAASARVVVSWRPSGANSSLVIPIASCSAPTPGSTSAGSATTPSSRPTAAGLRSFPRIRPNASPTAMPSGCSAARSNKPRADAARDRLIRS